MTENTSVLIVGGSLNGLSLALFLAHRGVRCIVVERHPATTVQYKFAGISPRSMEIYRGVGIERQIREHRTGDQKGGEIARARNLADPDVEFLGKPWASAAELAATTAETCDQNVLEPILRAEAERRGADVRFHTELLDFETSASGVRGLARNLEDGREYAIEADYLAAADGIGGKSRERLGIGRSGPGVLQHWMNLIFETDLTPYLQGRRFTSCFVTDLNATVTPRPERWLLSLLYQPERGERPEDFDAARTAELVRRAAGRDHVKAELYDARSWDVAAYLADRFRSGRAFLLGDAAHSMPPTGGFGGNTGIHDAHNLAWKLALVQGGAAAPELLETYEIERRFTAERTLAQALARLAAWFKDPSKRLPEPEPIVADDDVIFGYVYPPGGAVVAEPEAPVVAFENAHEPSGRPGSRAPHLFVEHAGREVPVHDLFGERFMLLADRHGAAWREAVEQCRPRFAAPLDSFIIQGAEPEQSFKRRYGVASTGAVLVRPDGHVAWRARTAPANRAAALASALDALGLLEKGAT